MKSPKTQVAARRDTDGFNSKAVLLVDDDHQLAEALKWILDDQNVQVDIAFNGEEALAKVKQKEYDVVVCDMVMPKMDGSQFHARATELFPGLAEKFIFITGHPEDPRSWEFLSCSQTKCLLKPFPMEDLIGAVKKTLR